jgi:hypothetical protein
MKKTKKIDDFDFVFINKPLTEKEDKEFSDFLKTRRTKLKQRTLEPLKRNRKAIV